MKLTLKKILIDVCIADHSKINFFIVSIYVCNAGGRHIIVFYIFTVFFHVSQECIFTGTITNTNTQLYDYYNLFMVNWIIKVYFWNILAILPQLSKYKLRYYTSANIL